MTISLTPRQSVLAAGGEYVVDVFAAGFVDLGGDEIALDATGGTGGRLDLENIYIDTTRKDHVFASQKIYHAIDKPNARMACALDAGGVDSQTPVYLATFVFRASSDASGTFTVSAVPGDGATGTLAADSSANAMTVNITSAVHVSVPYWGLVEAKLSRGSLANA